ncbi:hypothetical protein GQ43DRAFT_367420 [Delitschia confertaspora ATCC 74209]|uniref:P-type domain-containing protein n=1 Tax=Delitschia confertaspora ATCC 74209 TaxID=1513339 RepID=A0A9P4JRS5_9PLEO|nr:hypothetical protein GQ43DRAFT_367420 [Delitschia confertaspora ATCC 74209]
MKTALFLILAPLALATALPKENIPYRPCGRSIPPGVCSTKSNCYSKGGFYVQRDCPYYDSLDIGCCYDIPSKE